MFQRISTSAAIVLKFFVSVYQRALSPLLGKGKCRFYPCCSDYALEALEVHGALKGTLLSLWRLLRCGPWTEGGYDPVPPRGAWKGQKNNEVRTPCGRL